MRRPLVFLVAVALMPTIATATTRIVPDQYPTIQAALDVFPIADTILVREGDYPDSSVIDDSPVVLRAQPGAFPRIGRVTNAISGSRLEGFHVRELVRTTRTLTVQNCRLDASIVAADGQIAVRNSLVLGRGRIAGNTLDFTGNYAQGGLELNVSGGIVIRSNVLVGPGPNAIQFFDNDVDATVRDNRISGFAHGVLAIGNMGHVLDNEVFDIAGTAFASTQSAQFFRNVVRRCGGHAFDVGGGSNFQLAFVDNDADSVGGHGIRVTGTPHALAVIQGNRITRAVGTGIEALDGTLRTVEGNTVIAAGGDGIRLHSGSVVTLNVVGRSGGHGIVLLHASSGRKVMRNTVYLNADVGLALTGQAGDSLVGNIAHANLGPGLSWNGASPVRRCNDWHANGSGDVVGTTPGTTDVSVDPQFCSLPADDVSLAASSPLLSVPDCGQIGAKGQGCAAPLGIAGDSQGAGFRLAPQPVQSAARFHFEPVGRDRRLEIVDVAGKRVWQVSVPSGSRDLAWGGRGDEGHPLSPGVYFARLSMDGVPIQTTRFIVLR
jgi:hypothetical protein